MKNTQQFTRKLLLAAAVMLPLAAGAADDAPPMAGFDAPPLQAGPGMHPGGSGMQPGPGMPPPGMEHMRRGGMGEGHPDGPEFGPRGGFWRGIELSEAQQDKVFAILHAQAPTLREQRRAHDKAMRALHEMRESDKYDDAAAVKLTKAAGDALASLTLLEVRTDQKLLAVLTPEQRKQMDERKPQRPH